MAVSTGLHGPHTLSNAGIDAAAQGIGPGAYALGEVNQAGTFVVSYVGRSDEDLNARLKDHVGTYRHFKYGFLQSAEAAYKKECAMYHDFSPPGNSVHPARPKGSWLACHVCGS
jgi:hypothetical protein